MKKTMITFLLLSIIGTTSIYADELKYTFEDARKIAIQNSIELKIQDDIINSISNKNDIQKKDPYQNKPDYIYEGIKKIEVYSNGYKTYDYDKILKNETQKKKEMIIANEKKTFTLFSNIINYQNEIKTKQMEIRDKTNEYKQAELKLKSGLITKSAYMNTKNSLDQLETQLKSINSKLDLEEKKFKEHLAIEQNSKVSLVLTEAQLSALIPKDALSGAEKNKKSLIDLQDELKELQDDMKWIKEVNIGYNYNEYTKKQQELVDEKKKDINELKKNTLYGYDSKYNEILIKANELSLDKIDKIQLEIKKNKMQALYSKGYEKKSEIDNIDLQLENNLLSQIKKQLEIRWLVLDYENSMI